MDNKKDIEEVGPVPNFFIGIVEMTRGMNKLLVLICVPIIFYFLPNDTILGVFLHIAILLFVSALLLTIILGLASAVKFGTRPYLTTKYNNTEVSFKWRLNGGGIIAANEFVRIVSNKIGKVGHVFEYCAGPGFIGFALLANNLCDRLTLADVNPEAITAIKDTIKNNNLQDKVTVYHADCLDAIPETEQWDLVVGNPPWYLCSKGKKTKRGLFFGIREAGFTKTFTGISTNFLNQTGRSY